MMSVFNFDVDDPVTGPATPVVVLPVEPIGPLLPAGSAALTSPTDVRATADVIEKIAKSKRVRRRAGERLKAIDPPPQPHVCESMVRGKPSRGYLQVGQNNVLRLGNTTQNQAIFEFFFSET